MKNLFSQLKNEKGFALLFVFVILISLSVIVFAFLVLTTSEITITGANLRNAQVFYIAEAGLAKARWALTDGGETVGWGESDISFGEGTYTVTTVDNGDSTYTITSDGYIPDETDPIARRRVIEEDIPVTSGASNNLSIGATAYASSTQGGNTPDNANDGSSSTRWKSSVNNGSWIALDFGSATTLDRAVYTGSLINTIAVEYSTNGTTWTAVSGSAESPAGTISFNPVSAQHVRLSLTGNRPTINEFETYDTSGGGGVTLGQGKFITSF